MPLIDQAAGVLDALSRVRFIGPDDRVFANVIGGMLGEDAMRDALYAAMEAASVDRKGFSAKGGFVFHDLRHTFGTLAAELGFWLVEIQAWVGHAHISTTRIYAHHVPKRDAAARFTAGVEKAKAGNVPRTAENSAQLSAPVGTETTPAF